MGTVTLGNQHNINLEDDMGIFSKLFADSVNNSCLSSKERSLTEECG